MKVCAMALMNYVPCYKSDLGTKPACLEHSKEVRKKERVDLSEKLLERGRRRGGKGAKFLCLAITLGRRETVEYSTRGGWPVKR